MGVRSNLLRVIINLHCNLRSFVLHNGFHSDWFPVLQGTRQGGVISPFMYLCYIDELLNELCSCGAGFNIFGKCFAAPTVCDDMLLLALSKFSLDKLMSICYRYACKWRYEYSPVKSSVIVFNETKRYFTRNKRSWYLGPDEVNESENYIHLGSNFNKYLNLNVNLKTAIEKLKGTFMSFSSCGLIRSLNPLSCSKIYKAVVLPKALYGCETWYHLTESNILYLERAHRFCIKYSQSLGIRTRTDIALSLLGAHTLESEIDARKLSLLGQLCRLDSQSWIRSFFLIRLTSYNLYKNSQIGFIPDILRILEKYNLNCYIDVFLQDSEFPVKNVWKCLVKRTIHQYEVNSWRHRISAIEFSRFARLHMDYRPHRLWFTAYKLPHLLQACKSVIQMIASVSENLVDPLVCPNCNCLYRNLVEHCIYDCRYIGSLRFKFWNEIYILNMQLFGILMHMSKEDQISTFLGEESVFISSVLGDGIQEFEHICIYYLHKMWRTTFYRNMNIL